jgi:hypothetical protein
MTVWEDRAWMLLVILAAILLVLLFILLSGREALGTSRARTWQMQLGNITQGLALELGPGIGQEHPRVASIILGRCRRYGRDTLFFPRDSFEHGYNGGRRRR